MLAFKETIIIAVGGSLLVPDHIDITFINEIRDMTLHLVENNYQVVLVPGGGKIARNYQDALKQLGSDDAEALDWVGIKAIHLNCEMLLHAFSGFNIHPNIVYKPEEIKGVSAPIVLKAAFKPGNSSDVGAVRMANILGAKKIINFSNTSHVYSEDPRINPNAERFTTLSWKEYRELIPREWKPGLSAPFDPVAAKMAEESGMSVAILGASIENLECYLSGKEFEGTVIS
ncbi:UMP kinase [Patescibacteria group bacterium]|nr:UMP kinase [Patescibacteria group bacterium]